VRLPPHQRSADGPRTFGGVLPGAQHAVDAVDIRLGGRVEDVHVRPVAEELHGLRLPRGCLLGDPDRGESGSPPSPVGPIRQKITLRSQVNDQIFSGMLGLTGTTVSDNFFVCVCLTG